MVLLLAFVVLLGTEACKYFLKTLHSVVSGSTLKWNFFNNVNYIFNFGGELLYCLP